MQGRVTPFVDMRIVDDEGQELPRDGKAYGELQVRGPHVIQRYYRVRTTILRHIIAEFIGWHARQKT